MVAIVIFNCFYAAITAVFFVFATPAAATYGIIMTFLVSRYNYVFLSLSAVLMSRAIVCDWLRDFG